MCLHGPTMAGPDLYSDYILLDTDVAVSCNLVSIRNETLDPPFQSFMPGVYNINKLLPARSAR
jgi:hypothetical protein